MRSQAAGLTPLIGGTFLAMYPMMTTPILVGSIIERGQLSSEQAGWIGTMSIGAVAVTSMLIPRLLHHASGLALPFLFATILALGYAGFAVAQTFPAFATLAIISGAGAGGLLAAMAMRIARFDDPDRIYGIIYAAASLGFAALLFGLPAINARWGVGAGFLALALVVLLVMPILVRLDRRVLETSAHEVTMRAKPWGMIVIVILVMTIAFPIYGGVYAFSERRAVDIGLSPGLIGATLAAATVMTVIGALLVATIGTRKGRSWPTMVTMAFATLSYGLVLGATTPLWFVIGMLTFGLMQMAMNSYFFGLASALDKEGRVAAALQGYSLVPYALGAGLLGSVTGDGAMTRIAIPAIVINVVAALILLPTLLRLDRLARES